MAVGSGIGASVGVATETTYGTYVAPTRFYETMKSDFKKVKNTVQGGGLAAGRLAQAGARRVVTTEAGTGSLEVEATTTGLGLLLGHIFGTVSTPTQQAATPAYLQTYGLTDNVGRYMTVQNGVPDTTGVVRPYTFKGGKVTSAEFTCSVDNILTIALEYDFQKASEVETLVAPSYVSRVPFHFGDMRVRLGTFGAEAAVTGVRGFSLKIERGQAIDRFYASTAVPSGPGTKAEPLINDWAKVTGSFDVDFVTKADFADRYSADTATSAVIEFIKPTAIASTYFPTFSLTAPMIFLDGDTPTVDGPGITTGSFPFTAQIDLTNPLVSASYTSVDTTI